MIVFIKKCTSLLITLFIVSLMTFGVFQILPGDPALIILGPNADPLQLEALRESLGTNLPPLTRYIDWMTHALQGDLGMSFRFNQPVSALIASRLPVTLSLASLSFTLTLLISFPIALYSARKENFVSRLIETVSQIGIALPSFWVGILLILTFSVTLNYFPSHGYIAFSDSPLGWLQSLFLPSLSIAIGTSAVLIRYLRAALLDESRHLYVQVARSKGLSEKQVLTRHILKNALIPTLTILGLMVVDILGGSIITENVFTLPGLGNLIVSSINSRDLPLIQGLVLYLGTIVVLMNFLVDLLYTLIDPRIKVRG